MATATFTCSLQDPFGDRRGQFEYGQLLQRLKTLKSRLESLQNTNNNNASSTRSSSSKQSSIDARTREIMNDAASIDPNPASNDTTNLDDIFDPDDDEPNSSMGEDDDDDDEEYGDPLDDQQEVNVPQSSASQSSSKQSLEKTSMS